MCCPICLVPVDTDPSCNGACWFESDDFSSIIFQYCPEHHANTPGSQSPVDTEVRFPGSPEMWGRSEGPVAVDDDYHEGAPEVDIIYDEKLLSDWLTVLEEAQRLDDAVVEGSQTSEFEAALEAELQAINDALNAAQPESDRYEEEAELNEASKLLDEWRCEQ
ncbi:hypothetical protein O1611_g10456 [Lasiodiplodia mahajangana]|uniref:Uncharacterized protein n=1 Tax=Lasiodiplodia mahajangana TaxID=1108764 RepID=A0ACC2IY96_9PEZI|nr:hypothetical protein O1611_g10456 [Lasiodiplodia mahajangana]